ALADALEAMGAAVAALEQMTLAFTPMQPSSGTDGEQMGDAVISALDPGFRAQDLAFFAAEIAASAELAATAARRSWLDRVIGRRPKGRLADRLSAAQQR